MNARVVGIFGAAMATASLAGCGARPTPTLQPDAFVHRQPVVGPGSNEPIDVPGALAYEGQHAPERLAPDGVHISQTVRESIQPPVAQALREVNGSDFPPPRPFSIPATQPLAEGTSQTVGGVLAVVNQRPIYADKVLDRLDRALRAEARRDTPDRFAAFAADLVDKTVDEMIHAELEYAAAERALEPHDKELASFLTNQWRREQLSKAGGSEAVARQRFAEQGLNFDEETREQYRTKMIEIYYQRRIFPQVQVTAQDIREYYRHNERKYQKPAAARFRVLWISAEATGGIEKARVKAAHVCELAKSGEDFADLASRFDDDPQLRDKKGAVGDAKGWLEKGAFFDPNVEQQVWKLQPGQVTPPIAGSRGIDSGFFVAKLEELRPATSEPFDKVQDEIASTLRRQQFARLRTKNVLELMQKKIAVHVEGGEQVLMDLIMQRYARWASAR